jgi:predicted transcriptional regulator
MTKLMDRALEVVRRLPDALQDEIARAMLVMADEDTAPEVIPEEHLTAVLEGLAQARRGDFASESEVEAAFRRFEK